MSTNTPQKSSSSALFAFSLLLLAAVSPSSSGSGPSGADSLAELNQLIQQYPTKYMKMSLGLSGRTLEYSGRATTEDYSFTTTADLDDLEFFSHESNDPYCIIESLCKEGKCVTLRNNKGGNGQTQWLKFTLEGSVDCDRVATLMIALLASEAPPAPAAEIVTGTGAYFGFQQTSTPQDQEDRLGSLAGGRFERVSGSGTDKTFNDLCRAAHLQKSFFTYQCRWVIDWEGRSHACDSSSDDGSRMAYCGSDQPAGYYGWTRTETPQDQDENLMRLSNGAMRRIEGDWGGGTFDALCEAIGRTCDRVIDWEGHTQSCRADSGDGSRVVYCD